MPAAFETTKYIRGIQIDGSTVHLWPWQSGSTTLVMARLLRTRLHSLLCYRQICFVCLFGAVSIKHHAHDFM